MKKKWKINEEAESNLIRYAAALLAVLLIGTVLIAVQGENPGKAFAEILKGAFGSKINIGNTLRHTMPCILTAIAAAVAFKSGVNNLGLEGQIYFGALTAAVLGYAFKLPPGVHVIVCLLASGAAGMLYALLPAMLKLIFRVDELISTLMFNFIAVLLTEYITMWWIMGGRGSDGSNAISTPPMAASARLPGLIQGSSASLGIVFALLVAVLVYLFYRYTVKGYELKQVGENIRFARAYGIPVARTFLGIFLMSGFISGLCGGIEMSGSYGSFTAKFITNMGWDGILIAYIARQNPIAIVVVSFLWGALRAGSLQMERMTSLNKLTVNIIQMLFVLFAAIDYKALFDHMRGKHMRSREAG
ncbi:ABC transporter permease [Diplocloster hominis]|uniref:ABC transporter permease n=1 Tax=Diplocloster hominis TaxID=3079010 RepID=UPI0031BA2FC7